MAHSQQGDEYPQEYYDNPLHTGAASGSPTSSRGASFRDEGGRVQPPHMYGLDLGVDSQNYHGSMSAGSSQCGSPSRKQQGGNEIVKKLVRLNTNLRAQLEMEGWGNVGDEDGVLTEEELLEAARAQGVLKRSSSAWKYTAVLILALVGASFAIMLGLVVAGGILVRDTMTDSKSAIMATMNGQIVSTVHAESAYSLTDWESLDPTSLLHLSRVLLTANDGTILNEQIVSILADYQHSELFLQTGTGGWLWIQNSTLMAVNLNYYTWSPGQTVWHGNGNGTYLGLAACTAVTSSKPGGRRLQQIGVTPKVAKTFEAHGVSPAVSGGVTIKHFKTCSGPKGKLCGIPGCKPCVKKVV